MTSLAPLQGRYWRMLGVRWQRRPLESGSHRTGGRWNPMGMPALYLSADYVTAIVEMHQELVRPGTLAAYDVIANAIADLRGTDPAITECLWRQIFMVEKGIPPSWKLAEELTLAGAEGALVPSVQNKGGTNLVLWKWHDAGAGAETASGEGAALSLLDPEGALAARDRN